MRNTLALAMHAGGVTTEEPEVRIPRVGEGPLPARLNRVNPGAFLLAGLWTLVYGTWPWLFAFLALTVVNLGIGLWVRAHFGVSLRVSLVRGCALAVVSIGLRAVFALRANRLFWEKENRRIYSQEVPRAPDPVAKYEHDQRAWLLWGFALLGFGLSATLLSELTLTHWGTIGLRNSDPVITQAVFVALELVGLGVIYTIDRARQRRLGQS